MSGDILGRVSSSPGESAGQMLGQRGSLAFTREDSHEVSLSTLELRRPGGHGRQSPRTESLRSLGLVGYYKGHGT